ncbi:MAG: transcriptional regulator [Gammaproteobacteria bacterium]|jgi:ATP-dependent DNA helicase RecG|nr:transcriptional regulator [Gammaproteobacteria bacterium]
MQLDELLNQLDIGEDQDIEFKAASEHGLPKSIWETVSAFANTSGGYIVLGVAQNKDKLEIVGVKNPNNLRKIFWDTHNNPEKLSQPLCQESDIQILTVGERQLLIIHVPQALRTQKPIYINNNPATGAYKRNYEGDYRCTKGEISQMLRDASDEPQDARILEGFGLEDLDTETLTAFRNRFRSREPTHPFLEGNDKSLLQQIGGWQRNRITGKEGLTLAGLLMFGRERSILDALPWYHVDYQERLSDDPDERWTYRLTVDGKWQANLFNFFFRVYPRLVADLDLPFKLDEYAVRLGETPVHVAVREALVNTLIHADYQTSKPIIVVKKRDEFIFDNPGLLRISLEKLYLDGGVSDPRNPHLQKMLSLLGMGEKAGSGFQKILRAWREQHWFKPLVLEQSKLGMTRLWLRLASMIPTDVEQTLRQVVGTAYPKLSDFDRTILMLAHKLETIGNSDVRNYLDKHPREIGEHLKELVNKNWLSQDGHGRGTRYRLPISSGHLVESSGHLVESSGHLVESSGHLVESSEDYEKLKNIALRIRVTGKTDQALLQETILKLCANHYLTIKQLAELLNRKPESLRKHYINPMVDKKLLELRYSDKLNHPQQAYKAIIGG